MKTEQRGSPSLRVPWSLLLAIAGVALTACGFGSASAPPTAELTGTVTYRERIALLPETQLRVTLGEIARADAPAQFIAETTIPGVTQVPIAFRLRYDAAAIDPKLVYTLTARIERRDQVLFVNDRQVRVLTGGAPSRVEIVVAPVGGRRE
jgi:putative lipoprotein